MSCISVSLLFTSLLLNGLTKKTPTLYGLSARFLVTSYHTYVSLYHVQKLVHTVQVFLTAVVYSNTYQPVMLAPPPGQ